MAELFLYFEDRDKNISRMQLHTADFIYPDVLTAILPTLISAIEGISDAVFIKAQLVRIVKNTAYVEGTGIGIAERSGLIITRDMIDNVVTITLPAPKDTIWEVVGPMAGVIATSEVNTSISDALALFNPVSEFNIALDTDSIIVAKAI